MHPGGAVRKILRLCALHMKEGKSRECQKLVSLDVDKLNSCSNYTARDVAYARKDFDQADKLG
jgi:hypothetical protein